LRVVARRVGEEEPSRAAPPGGGICMHMHGYMVVLPNRLVWSGRAGEAEPGVVAVWRRKPLVAAVWRRKPLVVAVWRKPLVVAAEAIGVAVWRRKPLVVVAVWRRKPLVTTAAAGCEAEPGVVAV
jgi:hypothetical protein